MTRLMRGCCGGPDLSRGEGGTGNKYTFRKVLQLGFRKLCFHKDSLVRNSFTCASFLKYASAKMLKFLKLSQALAHFRKFGLAVFCSISQGFAMSQSFARFRKSSQLPRLRLATGRVAVTNGYSHRMFC